jgi:hypothetical protein
MRRRLIALATAIAALSLAAATTIAAPFPGQIGLDDGWAPEGIAAGTGTTAYVGSLSTGGVAEVDLRTGAVNSGFIEGIPGTVAVGVEYEAGANRLWVTGGPGQEVRVYDVASGDLLETYSFESGFVNDVVVTSGAAYATDSNIPQLMVIPLGADGSLPAPDETFTLDISGAFEYEDGFNANGIVAFGGWLIVPQSNTGELFAIDPGTGESVQLLPDDSIPSADGLELVGSTLYVVVRGEDFTGVATYAIRGAQVTPLGTMTSDDLDVPTTVAFASGRLWVVNARFGTPVTDETPYWITRLPAR